MGAVQPRQAVAQPPYQGIQRLLGDTRRCLIPPDSHHQVLPRDYAAAVVIQRLQQAELRHGERRIDLGASNPHPA